MHQGITRSLGGARAGQVGVVVDHALVLVDEEWIDMQHKVFACTNLGHQDYAHQSYGDARQVNAVSYLLLDHQLAVGPKANDKIAEEGQAGLGAGHPPFHGHRAAQGNRPVQDPDPVRVHFTPSDGAVENDGNRTEDGDRAIKNLKIINMLNKRLISLPPGDHKSGV